MGKCHIFEVLSNRLSITKIVVLIDKAVEHLLKRSSAYLFKPDRKQITDRRLNKSLVNELPWPASFGLQEDWLECIFAEVV